MKAGILKLAGETTKTFERLIVINGLFLQTQLCVTAGVKPLPRRLVLS